MGFFGDLLDNIGDVVDYTGYDNAIAESKKRDADFLKEKARIEKECALAKKSIEKHKLEMEEEFWGNNDRAKKLDELPTRLVSYKKEKGE